QPHSGPISPVLPVFCVHRPHIMPAGNGERSVHTGKCMPIRPPLRAVALMLGLTLSLTGFAATAQELEQTSTAAAFDQQLQNFHNGRFDALDASAEQRELERLHAWLPVGDAARELEYRTANCMHMVRHDPTAALKYAEQALVPAQEAGAAEVQARL